MKNPSCRKLLPAHLGAVVSVLLFAFSMSAQAVPVQYVFEGIGSGIDGMGDGGSQNAFTDTYFKLTLIGDTNNVFSPIFDYYAVPIDTAQLYLGGLGTWSLLTDVAIFTTPTNSLGLEGLSPGTINSNGTKFSADLPQSYNVGSGSLYEPKALTSIYVSAPLYAGTQLRPGGWVSLDEISQLSFSATVVPIPAAVWLFASGLGLLGWFRRKV